MYHLIRNLMHWGGYWKAKFTKMVKTVGRDEATGLLICFLFSLTADHCAPGGKPWADCWDCSVQRSLTAFRGLRQCSRMHIRLWAKPHAFGGIENKQKKWQHEEIVLAVEGLQCSISLAWHSMNQHSKAMAIFLWMTWLAFCTKPHLLIP